MLRILGMVDMEVLNLFISSDFGFINRVCFS